jgi:hypothetical protein
MAEKEKRNINEKLRIILIVMHSVFNYDNTLIFRSFLQKHLEKIWEN